MALISLNSKKKKNYLNRRINKPHTWNYTARSIWGSADPILFMNLWALLSWFFIKIQQVGLTCKIDKVQDNSSCNIEPFLLLTEDSGYGCHLRSHTQFRSATRPLTVKAENSASSFLPGSPAHFLLIFLSSSSTAALAHVIVSHLSCMKAAV